MLHANLQALQTCLTFALAMLFGKNLNRAPIVEMEKKCRAALAIRSEHEPTPSFTRQSRVLSRCRPERGGLISTA